MFGLVKIIQKLGICFDWWVCWLPSIIADYVFFIPLHINRKRRNLYWYKFFLHCSGEFRFFLRKILGFFIRFRFNKNLHEITEVPKFLE